MHIALCDDNPQELSLLADAIEQYAASQALPIVVQSFSDAESMLRAANSAHFTHYFLDIMMPVMDGISAAQEIRSFDTDARIIFLTTTKEYAYQSYRVKAHDYLLKPLKAQELEKVLDELCALEERAQACICIQRGSSFQRIPFSRISHVEVNQKHLYFCLTDRQIREVSGTLSEFEKTLLARPGFVKIHRSYIVNLRQISALSPQGCRMFTGENLPVSRLLYQQVQQRFMAHLFEDGEV